MIDLHAHVLPGIDDGPANLDGALELIAACEADGIHTLAATPHIRFDHPDVVPAELADRAARLGEAVRTAGLGVRVVVGGEIDLLWSQRASDEELRLVSYGQRGSDLLVETPYGELPPNFETALFELALRGYRTLLAHPERSPTFRRDPDRLVALVAKGVLVQVTAAAIAAPRKGSASARFARALIDETLVHVIASDAHAVGGSRSPGLREAVEAAARTAPLRAAWMVSDAPAAILAGEPLPEPPSERSRRRWFRRR